MFYAFVDYFVVGGGGTTTELLTGSNVNGGRTDSTVALVPDTILGNRVGVMMFSSGATINGGYAYFGKSECQWNLVGNEFIEVAVYFQTDTLLAADFKFGWNIANTTVEQNDEISLKVTNGGLVIGRTSNGSSASTTGLLFQVVGETWYTMRIENNSDSTGITYTVYSEAGVVLATATLTTNIKLVHRRLIGMAARSATAGAKTIAAVDYLRWAMPRPARWSPPL